MTKGGETRPTVALPAIVALAAAALMLPVAASASTAYPYLEPTGSMLTTRAEPMAAPLPGGDVLVAGGWQEAPSPYHGRDTRGLDTAEIYDSATGTFAPTGQMTQQRFGAAIAPLLDGRVLIAGGFPAPEGDSAMASAELYDPATGVFTPTGAMTVARHMPAAALLPDGRILLVGGRPIGSNVAHPIPPETFARAEIYDPTTGTFSPTGSMATPRWGPGAASLPDGRVLVAGGYSDEEMPSSAEIFDPAPETFSPTGGMSSPESGDAANLSDGTVLFVGDHSIQEYDPIAATFSDSVLSSAPHSWRTALAPLPGGRALLAGGVKGGDPTDDTEIYVSAPSPTSPGLDFGTVPPLKTSAPKSLTVTNLGAQDLTIDGVSLGPAATEFAIANDGCAGSSLAFGESCNLLVTVTPVTYEPLIASIEVTDNSPSSPQSFPLAANALKPLSKVPSAQPEADSSTPRGPRAPRIKFLAGPLKVKPSGRVVVASISCPPEAGGPCSLTKSTASLASGGPPERIELRASHRIQPGHRVLVSAAVGNLLARRSSNASGRPILATSLVVATPEGGIASRSARRALIS